MPNGNIDPPDNAYPATFDAQEAVVEIKKHVFTSPDHTWPGAWVESDTLRATRVTWNSDANPNISTIMIEGVRIEDWQDEIDPVDQIQVVLKVKEIEINSNGEVKETIVRKIIFRGFPISVLLGGAPGTETITITAAGYRWYMNRIAVHSQQVWGVDSGQVDTEFETNRPLIFNEGGMQNRLADDAGPNGNGRNAANDYFMFIWGMSPTLGDADHDFWTADQAIEYIVNRFPDPDADLGLDMAIGYKDYTELSEIILPEVNVEGLNLSDAVTRIFSSIGYHWTVLPDSEDGQFKLTFWKPGTGLKSYEVVFPEDGSALATEENAILTHRFDLNYDYGSIVNKYIGIGDVRRYEKAWALEEAWDSTLESANDEFYYRSGFDKVVNPDWETYKNVFRRWAIDGAGLITDTKKDFGVTLGDAYEQRPRFLDDKALTAEDDLEGTRKPAKLFVNDGTWKQIDTNIDVFDKGFADGIYFDGKTATLDGGEASQPMKDILETVVAVDLVSAIESDEAVTETAEDTASEESYLTHEKSLRLPAYQYEKRWTTAGIDDYGATAVLLDESEELAVYIDKKVDATAEPAISASITLPILYHDFTPGTTITKIKGRDITIGAEIVTVDFLLEPEQSLQLSLSDVRQRRFV